MTTGEEKRQRYVRDRQAHVESFGVVITAADWHANRSTVQKPAASPASPTAAALKRAAYAERRKARTEMIGAPIQEAHRQAALNL